MLFLIRMAYPLAILSLSQLPIRHNIVPMWILIPEFSHALSVSETELLRYRNHSFLSPPFSVQLKTRMTIVLLFPNSHLLLFWTLIQFWILSLRIIDSCNPMRMARCNLTLHSLNWIPHSLWWFGFESTGQRICWLELYRVTFKSEISLIIWMPQNRWLLNPFLIHFICSTQKKIH